MTPGGADHDNAVSFLSSLRTAGTRLRILLPTMRGIKAARKVSRLAVLLAVTLFATTLGGCGTGNSLSGGSIPSGGTRASVLKGQVLSAESPYQPLAGSSITVTATPDSGAPQSLQTVADANGSFAVVLSATGVSQAQVDVTVDPADSTIQPLHKTFTLPSQHIVTLIAALPSKSFDISEVKAISLSPSVNVHVGDTVRLSVKVTDASGKRLPILPTLLLDGNFGTINSDGTFTGTGIGTSDLVASWYGNITTSAKITSDLTTPQLPPPVPGTWNADN